MFIVEDRTGLVSLLNRLDLRLVGRQLERIQSLFRLLLQKFIVVHILETQFLLVYVSFLFIFEEKFVNDMKQVEQQKIFLFLQIEIVNDFQSLLVTV